MSQTEILRLKEQFNVHVDSKNLNGNGLSHYSLKMSMPKEEFKRRQVSIRKVLYGMGYTKIKDFDDLRTCSLDPHLNVQIEVINDTYS